MENTPINQLIADLGVICDGSKPMGGVLISTTKKLVVMDIHPPESIVYRNWSIAIWGLIGASCKGTSLGDIHSRFEWF
jgi:hypothetical protein